MSEAALTKAKLIVMEGNEPSKDETKSMSVQFNPSTLKVSLSNALKVGKKGDAPTQYIDKSSSSLSFDLVFDTSLEQADIYASTNTPENTNASGQTKIVHKDVRNKTHKLVKLFLKSPGKTDINSEDKKKGKKPDTIKIDKPPPRCRFQWGSFAFTGMLSSYAETLDFFSPAGIPLRATLSLVLKEDAYQFEFKELKVGDKQQHPALFPMTKEVKPNEENAETGFLPSKLREFNEALNDLEQEINDHEQMIRDGFNQYAEPISNELYQAKSTISGFKSRIDATEETVLANRNRFSHLVD